ncbi:Ribosome quality control complex subunit 1-like protein [Cladobotryum mycophilum]|uniref:Ribosome quality control complex subunit 1-like protein n=1 Tax=Cladobotryum mycophilum TaxID=491253 RepID=A0ABR0SZI4_9HYPO
MSSRQLRRLQKQREQEEKFTQEAESSDEPEEPQARSSKPRPNLFAALGGGDEDDAKDVDEEVDEDIPDAEQDIIEAPAPAEKKKSKKKKKKNKSKATSTTAEEDEIDKAIKELGISSQPGDESSAAKSTSEAAQEIKNLLKINPYHLKVAHEMRNLFGREVIESASAEEEQETNRRMQQMPDRVDLEAFLREPPGAKGLPEVTLRRNAFIQGREHWPRASVDGLTMEEVGPAQDGSGTEYTYACNGEYNRSQNIFFTFVQMGDPMQMVRYLKQAPYHITTLIQVSNVAIQDQNMALSAELLERALFTLGRVTTSSFRQDIEDGKARLDFRKPENRQLWLAGYHYIRSLIRKGTYRTALEWAKLLFALDPRDPYAMRHFVQFLAMKSHEASWLLSFLEELVKANHNGDTAYLQQTRVPALLQMGNMEQARDELAVGMQQLPWLYCTLFQKLNLDAPPSIWGINVDSDARGFWTGLYLSGAQDSWNNAEAKALLEDVAKNLSRVNVAILPSDDPPVDRGSVRFAMLEGQRVLLAVAPRELVSSEPNYDFDPLPPPREENIFRSSGFERAFPRPGDLSPGEESSERLMEFQREILRRGAEMGARLQPAHDGVDDIEATEWPAPEPIASAEGALNMLKRDSLQDCSTCWASQVAGLELRTEHRTVQVMKRIWPKEKQKQK